MRLLWALWLAIGWGLGVAVAAPVTFRYTPPQGTEVRTVSLRGQMNNWGETPMRLENGVWSVTVEVPPGRVQYKFFINGQWPRDMCAGGNLAGPDGKIDLEAEGCVDDGNGGKNAFRTVSGQAAQTPPIAPRADAKPAPPLEASKARIHYFRPDGNYAGWGLHLWEDTLEQVEWSKPFPPTGQDDYGLYWDFRLKEGAKKVGFIVHKGDEKDPGPDMFLLLDQHGREVWVLSGSTRIYTQRPDTSAIPTGDLSKAQAHWLTRDTVAWNPTGFTQGATVRLFYSPSARLNLTRDGITGGFPITLEPATLSEALKAKYPHLRELRAFKLPADELEKVPGILKGQFAVAAFGADGKLLDATSLQIPGVLDDLFFYDGPLGVTFANDVPTLRLWAPTARSVKLLLFDSSTAQSPSQTLEMTEEKGVWSLAGRPDWKNKFYLYEVQVFVRSTGKIETNQVTDPYSLSLSLNSKRSQIVNLNDPALKPQGWDALRKPPLDAFEDIVLYELHVRDFSASDPSVPADLRGTFKAFTLRNSNGMKHLSRLAQAGLTHIHLLPTFDIATINEDKSTWKTTPDLSQLPPDSEEQQAAVAAIRGQDGFNWGYDPYHFNVPEGSYSTNPDGPSRIAEFREMVQSLNDIGLRVVIDVVYNHTHAAGQDEKSVFDRIVPGYYHRLNKDGNLETSTCCANTASEHRMMEKFMVDSVVLWAKAYKVDGFRFDLMGHHMKANMEQVRRALDGLTLEKDGVDGKKIYVYGEGWNFGEVANNARGVNATQINLAGTGLGTFNDRIRDAIRGGNPFGDLREQGFATGLFSDPSNFTNQQGNAEAQRNRLLMLTDWLKTGLAGGLKNYKFTDRSGNQVSGEQVKYGDAPAGYTLDPQETINYTSAHDNETIWDAVQAKASEKDNLADRVRINNLALSLVMLSQGVPFFHAGDDLLRSKSLDRDSYDSGDWFNRIDWTYQTNNWGVGLPLADKNRDNWPWIKPLLANPALKASPADIQFATRYFQELLRLRKSSPLFRLRTGEDVQNRLFFLDTRNQPGVVAMLLEDRRQGLADLDPKYQRILVVFNAAPQALRLTANLPGNWQLHPLQRDSVDAITKQAAFSGGVFSVPGRTTAVFVLPQ